MSTSIDTAPSGNSINLNDQQTNEIQPSNSDANGTHEDDDLDLDQELEAAFDDPVEPATPEPSSSSPTKLNVPPSPERKESEQPTAPSRSILASLAANQSRLRGHAARLATSALSAKKNEPGNNKVETNNHSSIVEAMRLRRSCSKSEANPAEVAKRAKNGFKVARTATRKLSNSEARYRFIDDTLSNMSLRDCPYSKDQLTSLFSHAPRVDLAEIRTRADDIRAGRLPEFIIYVCLVRKVSKKQTSKGSSYAVWRVCNMPRGSIEGFSQTPPPTELTLLLFDSAFEAFHTTVEGAVFAIRRPSIMPPRENVADQDNYGLTITKKDSVFNLGVCADFSLCQESITQGVCGKWFDANRTSRCILHERKRITKMTRGTRMDVNNAQRPIPTFPRTKGSFEAPNMDGKLRRDEQLIAKQEEEQTEAQFQRKRDNLRKEALIRNRQVPLKRSTSNISRIPSNKRWRSNQEIMRADNGFRSQNPIQQMRDRRALLSSDSQKKYEEAVATLCKIGFVLTESGSLIAPRSGNKIKLLKRNTNKGQKSFRDNSCDGKKHEANYEEDLDVPLSTLNNYCTKNKSNVKKILVVDEVPTVSRLRKGGIAQDSMLTNGKEADSQGIKLYMDDQPAHTTEQEKANNICMNKRKNNEKQNNNAIIVVEGSVNGKDSTTACEESKRGEDICLSEESSDEET